jgi:hypothetical protein
MQMRSVLLAAVFALTFAAPFVPATPSPAQQPATPPVALTIYNQDFAVARTSIDLDLHPGVNEVTTTGVTSRLEPDSVILRDPAGKRPVHILEQNYDAAIVNQDWLLQKYEGKTIDFQNGSPHDPQIVQGKIIRAPSIRPPQYSADGQYIGGQNAQPLIEVNGKMMFQLPGVPLFPATTDGLLLKPTLRWQIHAEKGEHFPAELAYITGGLDWNATYNVVIPDSGSAAAENEKADIVGWVTIHNQSGTDFPQARIKLMAGDVAKIQQRGGGLVAGRAMAMAQTVAVDQVQVTQKAFDDFHLYDLNRTVALRDGETKQIEFLEAAGVAVRRSYRYDGGSVQGQPYYNGNVNEQSGFGLDSGNTKVVIVQEIKNSESNHLGMPLPAGRLRLYRRDSDGQMEFVGENMIGHTPAEETVKLVTGNAFDLKGERRQTDFWVNHSGHALHESFDIKLTNQKEQPVTVVVTERLYRGDNWEITSKSSDYTKRDSHTIEFPVKVPAKGSATLTYTVHYTW